MGFMMSKTTDQIYADPLPSIPIFEFDDAVAAVFTDMINRSVPGYQSVLALLGSLSKTSVANNSNVYDLGCSLGASSLVLQQHINADSVSIIGIDNSAAMIERASKNLNLHQAPSIELRCENVLDTNISNASLVCMNLTLQFIAPNDRQSLLETIYAGLNPGGVLMLFEKVCFDDPLEEQRMTKLYYDYKAANGYTEMEISQKRTALEQKLIPDTPEKHQQRLRAIGFKPVSQVFQALNFIAWIGWKQ